MNNSMKVYVVIYYYHPPSFIIHYNNFKIKLIREKPQLSVDGLPYYFHLPKTLGFLIFF